MSLQRFCRKEIAAVSPTESVFEAAQKMREHHVGAVVVTESGKPVGMLTDRDVVLRVVLEGRNPQATSVQDAMSRTVATARSEEQIDDVVHRMRESRVRRLPIVDHAGRVVGLVSLDDLVVLLSAELGEAVAAVRSNRGD